MLLWSELTGKHYRLLLVSMVHLDWCVVGIAPRESWLGLVRHHTLEYIAVMLRAVVPQDRLLAELYKG